MEVYLSTLRQYATFTGRASRKEYWTFSLINGLIMAILYIVGIAFAASNETLAMFALGAYFVFALAMLIPGIAVTTRRLHDIGKSGWWQLLGVVPIIGPIVLLVWALTRGTDTANTYGEPVYASTPSTEQDMPMHQ